MTLCFYTEKLVQIRSCRLLLVNFDLVTDQRSDDSNLQYVKEETVRNRYKLGIIGVNKQMRGAEDKS